MTESSKKYRHTVTFVTEIDEAYMSGFTLMNWLAMPERDRANLIKDSTKSILKDLITKANDRGSWAILKVVE